MRPLSGTLSDKNKALIKVRLDTIVDTNLDTLKI